MSDESGPQRTVLPNPDIPPPGLTTYDAKDPQDRVNLAMAIQ